MKNISFLSCLFINQTSNSKTNFSQNWVKYVLFQCYSHSFVTFIKRNILQETVKGWENEKILTPKKKFRETDFFQLILQKMSFTKFL